MIVNDTLMSTFVNYLNLLLIIYTMSLNKIGILLSTVNLDIFLMTDVQPNAPYWVGYNSVYFFIICVAA